MSVGIGILRVKLGQEKRCEGEVEGLIAWPTPIFFVFKLIVLEEEVAARGSGYESLPYQLRVQHPLDGLIL
jgi:hypothetical protein